MPPAKNNDHGLGRAPLLDPKSSFLTPFSVKEDSCAVSYLPCLEAEKQYGPQPEISYTVYCVSGYRQGDQKHHFLQETQQALQASHDPLVEIKLD